MAELWARIRDNYQVLTAIALVAGIALITVAEMPDMSWTRVFGAGAISLGAVGLGIYLSGASPDWYQTFRERLASFKVTIGMVILALVFLPALLGLFAGFAGLLSGAEGTGWVVVSGVIILAILTIAMIVGLLVGVRAVLAAGEPAATSPSSEADDS